jgi:hypothetical protein
LCHIAHLYFLLFLFLSDVLEGRPILSQKNLRPTVHGALDHIIYNRRFPRAKAAGLENFASKPWAAPWTENGVTITHEAQNTHPAALNAQFKYLVEIKRFFVKIARQFVFAARVLGSKKPRKGSLFRNEIL